MNIEEMGEVLEDLKKQYKESSELSLKIMGAIELAQKMIQQDQEKAEQAEVDKAETADDLVNDVDVIKADETMG
tara:strand:- start:791 stop:1012 length:222 start_codon:yes stop_codon:yes gene_type:complete